MEWCYGGFDDGGEGFVRESERLLLVRMVVVVAISFSEKK